MKPDDENDPTSKPKEIEIETFDCHHRAIHNNRVRRELEEDFDEDDPPEYMSPCDWGDMTAEQIGAWPAVNECPKHREERLGKVLDRFAKERGN
jgi:hypothetical protein